MYRAFKTRLKVNNREVTRLRQWCGVSRLAYNVCLNHWNQMVDEGLKPNRFSVKKWFNSVKRERYPFVYEVSKCVGESAIKDLSDGFTRMFKGQNGHPTFRKKGVHNSFRIDGSSVKLEGRTVVLPLGLRLHMMEDFRYASCVTKINNVTVREKNQRWWISISCQIDDVVCENQADGIVGIDMGIKTLAVCSDGLVIENPKMVKARLKRRNHLQRALSRKRKGSRNYAKAKLQLARYEEHTAAQRHDYIHKATHEIAQRNAMCFMEGLNVSNMLGNHRLAQAISDASFATFKYQLSYKTHVTDIDRWYPSSQICSTCGNRQSMPLEVRDYICDSCGLHIDRDVNAALNILHIGLASDPN